MLAVILKILSIIGIVLLSSLCVILFIILLVLFMPIVYKIDGVKNETLLLANVKIRWLFDFIRVRYAYPEPGKIVVKILWFTVFDSSKTNKTEEVITSQNDDKPVIESQVKEVTPDTSLENMIQDANADIHTVQNETDTIETTEEKNKKSFWDKLLEKYEKIKYTIQQICDKIKHILENIAFYKELLTDADTQLLISHAAKRVGKIVQHIRPRKMKADVIFGTGSPDTTGYTYAIYGMFSPQLGKNVCITPDFEQKILLGSVYTSGHITVFTLLVNVLAIVVDRRLRMLISRLKAHGAKTTTVSMETNNQ